MLEEMGAIKYFLTALLPLGALAQAQGTLVSLFLYRWTG